MENKGWLYALLGVLAGVVLGRRLVQRRKPNPGQPRRATTAKPDSNRRLTREDVLRMIGENGGPEGLDLSYCDLSGVDFGSLRFFESTLKWFLDDENAVRPTWVLIEDGNVGVNFCGANLRGVNFRGASLRCASFEGSELRGADFERADCWEAIFRRAYLRRANFANAYLKETGFREAYLGRCTFESADLEQADLFRANLQMSDLSNAFLLDANLRGANLRETVLLNTKFRRESIGEGILFEETPSELQEHFSEEIERHGSGIGFKGDVDLIPKRHAIARDIYTSLKNNFTSLGQYRDASWAYVKERQLGKKTHWPPSRARECHPEELETLTPSGLKHMWQFVRFYARHLYSYLTDWIVELACGYGEKPLRTLWWALAIVMVLPVFYWLSGGIVSAGGTPLTWLDYLNYSFGAFTTIGFARFTTANWIAETLTSLEALLGISVLALLMFALGNRISRS